MLDAIASAALLWVDVWCSGVRNIFRGREEGASYKQTSTSRQGSSPLALPASFFVDISPREPEETPEERKGGKYIAQNTGEQE